MRQFLAFSETAAQKEGLAPQQHQALLAIKGFGGALTIGELADKLLIKPHTAAELVERLLKSGFIRKETDQNDRRRTWLSLSAVAEKRLKSLSHAHRNELERLAPLLKPLLQSWVGER
ncbi:MAG TPA: helix-turn-helix domain-containing protein [Rhizomicrobium sp.]